MLVDISFLILNSHIQHKVSLRLLVPGAVEAVPVGAPQEGPAVGAQSLQQRALPTQASDHDIGDPKDIYKSIPESESGLNESYTCR